MDADGPVRAWDGVDVTDLLVLETLDRDLFRNRLNQENANGSLFGGQVLAQSLAAAVETVADLPSKPLVHSLHGYFLRAGKMERPVIYQVDRTRDGGRFSTRRVTAVQNGDPIFHMECGFHAPEEGFEHQDEMPEGVPGPDNLLNMPQLAAQMGEELPEWARLRWAKMDHPLEVRPVDPQEFLYNPDMRPRRRVWMKMHCGHGASAADHACMLAYLSDYMLASTAAMSHSFPLAGPELFMASLDHAMWFHRPLRVDEWLLLDCESPAAAGGRGVARARIFTRDGLLVASVAQEALLRVRRPD